MGDKTTIFAGEESVLYTLNDTAAYIFNGLKLGWDNDRIIKGLVTKYDITPLEAEEDVEQFTKNLIANKIISLDETE